MSQEGVEDGGEGHVLVRVSVERWALSRQVHHVQVQGVDGAQREHVYVHVGVVEVPAARIRVGPTGRLKPLQKPNSQGLMCVFSIISQPGCKITSMRCRRSSLRDRAQYLCLSNHTLCLSLA